MCLQIVADGLSPLGTSGALAQYAYDPCAFVHDCIAFQDDERVASYQDEILQEIVERKKVAIDA